MIHTISGMTRRMGWLLAAGIAATVPLLAHAGKDRLDTPAYRAAKASSVMMLSVSRAGNRLVAVGAYGTVLYSDTNGKTWEQAEVPVSVTLTAVCFPTPNKGWAVGHDGVILRTDDGGARWTKQFDGNKGNALILAAARNREKEARAGAGAGQPPTAALQAAERALEDAQAGSRFGPSRPLLGVWFKDESQGIAVGAFGQVFHTADGGQTWALWGNRIDNRDSLHYNAIVGTARGALLIAGEGGKLYRSADGGATWATLDTGYQGQLYGAVGVQDAAGRETLIAFGFGGRVFRSTDDGAHWQRVMLDEKRPVVFGNALPDGRIALLTYDGKILRSDDQGQSLTTESGPVGMSVAAMASIGNDAFAVAGENGVRIVSTKTINKAKQP
jgi:photosystem II stability/assembly factor-like uncharacterized protein